MSDVTAIQKKAWRIVGLYRGLNLAMVLVLMFLGANMQTAYPLTWVIFIGAVAYSLAVFLNGAYLWPLIEKRPSVLVVDIIVSVALVSVSGGWASPYYLYSFSPVLMAGVVLGLRETLFTGLVTACGFFVGAYANGSTLTSVIRADLIDDYVAAAVSYLFVALLFSYTASLSKQLALSNAEVETARTSLAEANTVLSRSNRQLLTLQALGAAVQSSLDLRQVLSTVATSLVYGLDLKRMTIGLVDDSAQTLTNWYTFDKAADDGQLKSLEGVVVPIDGKSSLASMIDGRKPFLVRACDKYPFGHPDLAKLLGRPPYFCAPLWTGDELIGLILGGDVPDGEETRRHYREVLAAFTAHASLGIHNARLYIDAQELAAMRERNRIAMEIHDGLTQTISGARLILGSCQKTVRTEPETAEKQLDLLAEVLSRSYDEARHAIFNLRTPILAEEGLARFIKRRLREFQDFSGVTATLVTSGDDKKCGEEAQFCLSRVFQEGLANTMKHARARHVRAELEMTDSFVSLRLTDDGVGFDVNSAADASERGNTFGMFGLRRRVEALGGHLVVESAPGKGTTVMALVPSTVGGVVKDVAFISRR